MENSELHDRIKELEHALRELVSTSYNMYSDSYAGASSAKWIHEEIAQCERVLNRGIGLDSNKEAEDGKQ